MRSREWESPLAVVDGEGFVCTFVGRYVHSKPRLWHKPHSGCFSSHFEFASGISVSNRYLVLFGSCDILMGLYLPWHVDACKGRSHSLIYYVIDVGSQADDASFPWDQEFHVQGYEGIGLNVRRNTRYVVDIGRPLAEVYCATKQIRTRYGSLYDVWLAHSASRGSAGSSKSTLGLRDGFMPFAYITFTWE